MKAYAASVLLVALLAGCGGEDTPPPRADSTSSSPSAEPGDPTTTAAGVSPSETPASPSASAPSTARATDLADGRHYFRLKGLDPTARTITIDVVQFLTGEEARQAAEEDDQEAYDYYIRNQNDRQRTLTVAPDMTVVVNTLSADETGSSTKDHPITVEKLRAYFTEGKTSGALFYLALTHGVVTSVREQYLP
jgi:hypothetical protein